MVRWVETDTLLRTRDELFWATLRVLGYERAGPKITPAIQTAIAAVRGPVSSPAPRHRRRRRSGRCRPPRVRASRRNLRHVAADSRVPSGRPTGPPTAAELQALMAVRIRYVPKAGYGVGTERIVNPLHLSGNLMWAW